MLRGIITHTGSAARGHYIATVRRDNTWFQVYDNTVTRCSIQDVPGDNIRLRNDVRSTRVNRAQGVTIMQFFIYLVCIVSATMSGQGSFAQLQQFTGSLTSEGIAQAAGGYPYRERQLRAQRGASGAGFLPPPSFQNLPQQDNASAWWRPWRNLFLWMIGRGQVFALHRAAPFRPLNVGDTKPWRLNHTQQEFLYQEAIRNGATPADAMGAQILRWARTYQVAFLASLEG